MPSAVLKRFEAISELSELTREERMEYDAAIKHETEKTENADLIYFFY
jgi:hypothetical protein